VSKWIWAAAVGVGVIIASAGNPVLRSSGLAMAQGPAAQPAADREFLARNCVVCHNQRLKTAGLALDDAELSQIGGDAPKWEKVVRKLRTGSMPPPGRPRPDPAATALFVSGLESALDRAAAIDVNPGRPAVHRLNRAEYGNAIRDLLGVEADVRTVAG
jgi:mono/diheme cytochrome c family protein